jgi:glutathione synthase/RimK-type ligase-like ATP-grasp enzyme
VRLTRTRQYQLLKNAAKRLVPGDHAWHGPLDDGDVVAAVDPVLLDWPDGVRKPVVGLVRDADDYPYWTKYRRFLEANDVTWRAYDVHRSGWLKEAEELDCVLWRPMSFPSELEECRRKTYILERELGVLCSPGFDEAMLYEDKLLQYELLSRRGLPVIPTFVSHSEEETLAYVRTCAYPAVWKIATGSGSFGVELVKDARQAERWVRSVFSFHGRRTYWPYDGQKDYVFIQRLEPNAGWDLRVISVGDLASGYYRDVPDGEFRASGMDTVRRGAPPQEALRLAHRVRESLGLPSLAVDMLAAPDDGRLSIIETSSFMMVRTPMQLQVDGVPGLFVRGDDEVFRFTPAVVWQQELVLREVLRRGWIEAGRGR